MKKNNKKLIKIIKDSKHHTKKIGVKKEKRIGELNQDFKIGLLDKYEVHVDKTKVEVQIKREVAGLIYDIHIPEVKNATASLLNEVRNELVAATTLSMREITNIEAFAEIKEKFMTDALTRLRQKMPTLDKETEDFLVSKLMQDMLGLGEIEFLISDALLEEIVIPSSNENIRVYHKKYGWLITSLNVKKEEDIINYCNIVARRVGRQITILSPLLDAHLVTGDRANAILYPISSKGSTITIRKFARDPYSIVDLINSKTCDIDSASLLWLAIEYEMSIIISGGTASGKTVLLNACMSFMPPNHRIISVEDTRELMLPDFLYWTPLITRTPNPEGKGEVSMLDLLINSLRMRPDRIILGEMRKQQEAMVLFEAMHTGHSVYATLHADSAAETISRLTNPPLNIPANLLKAVDLNVVMFRDRRKGIRRILQIAEFESGEGTAEANILYRWVPEDDKMVKHSESSKFFESLSRNTGMSQSEINENLSDKKKILNFMLKNNIRELNDFGRVIRMAYGDKKYLLELINKNELKKILGK